MNLRNINVMIIGDSPYITTGLSTLSLEIALELFSRKANLSYVNISATPNNKKNSKQESRYRIISDTMNVYESYALSQNHLRELYAIIDKEKPSIIIGVHDPYMLSGVSAIKKALNSFAFVIYQTVETEHYPPTVFSPGYSFDGKGILLLNRCSIKEVWESADRIIPVTTIGKHTIEKLSPNNVVDAIYPGVTTSCVPVQGYTNAFPPSKKLVMTVGINRPRKALDRVILAFAKALQQDESLILYLHTSLEFQGGYDLAGIISDLGIESSIYYSKDYTYGYGITRAELDAIYSMAYCYIGLPCAEGFGYGFAEAMRFGKPVIYSSYGCHTELCEGCGIMVPINNYTHGVNSCIRWGNADIDKAAEALCYLSSHPDEAYEYGQKGKEKVSNLLWSNQAPLIVDKIIDCYNSKKSSLRKQTAFFKTDNPSNFLAGFSKLI